MSEHYAVLPCNGLDKCAGPMSREIALHICEATASELICPVLYHAVDARYHDLVGEKPLLVIDGCPTRCASKLAADKELKIARKITVTEEAKKQGEVLSSSLRLGEREQAFCRRLAEEFLKPAVAEAAGAAAEYPAPGEYLTYTQGKFVFKVPASGFYFTENDCWLQKVGSKARIGITDYMQQSLSDILFYNPPEAGMAVEQFGEAGSVESGKAVFELVCPVSGVVTAVNTELLDRPELVNQSPYEQGWIAELELTQFAEEEEFLLAADAYMQVLKKKVDEIHAGKR